MLPTSTPSSSGGAGPSLPRVRWKVLVATTALAVAALVLAQTLVGRLSVSTRVLPVVTDTDWVAAAVDAVGQAVNDAGQAVDDVGRVVGQAVNDAGQTVVDVGKAVVGAGQAAGEQLLDQLGIATGAGVPFVPMAWERPQAVWRAPDASSAGTLAFELVGAPIPMPLEVSLDTGVQLGSVLNITGRLNGNVVVGIMSTNGAIIFACSYQPSGASSVIFYSDGDWRTTPVPYPDALKRETPINVVIEVTAEGYVVTMDGAVAATVPYSAYGQPHQFGILLVRAYETLPHVVAVTRVTATGLPRTRVTELPVLTTADRGTRMAPLNASTEGVEVFVGVMSSASNYAARDGVRNAWFLDRAVRDGKVAVRFFVGHSHDTEVAARLADEHLRYGDLIQISAPEAYLNVGYKTLAMVETLLSKTSARYLLKCDDDTFLRLDRILDYLHANGQPPVYMGHISPASSPSRNPVDRYFISRAVLPQDSIPPFAHGPAYLLSRDLAGFIVAGIHRGNLHVLPLEDVAMASWVDAARAIGGMAVRYVSDGRFRIFTCDPAAFNGHYISPSKMRCMWGKVESGQANWCC